MKKIYLYIFRVNYFIEMTVKVSFSRNLHISQVSDKRYTRGRFCLISVFSLVALEPARLWLQYTRLYRHLIKLNRVRISRGGWSLCSGTFVLLCAGRAALPVALAGARGSGGAAAGPCPPRRPLHGRAGTDAAGRAAGLRMPSGRTSGLCSPLLSGHSRVCRLP